MLYRYNNQTFVSRPALYDPIHRDSNACVINSIRIIVIIVINNLPTMGQCTQLILLKSILRTSLSRITTTTRIVIYHSMNDQLYYDDTSKVEQHCDLSVCLSVCLFHALESKAVRFLAIRDRSQGCFKNHSKPLQFIYFARRLCICIKVEDRDFKCRCRAVSLQQPSSLCY